MMPAANAAMGFLTGLFGGNDYTLPASAPTSWQQIGDSGLAVGQGTNAVANNPITQVAIMAIPGGGEEEAAVAGAVELEPLASKIFAAGTDFERSFVFGETKVGVLADVSVSGSNLTISNIAVYAESDGAVSIENGAVKSMFNSVAAETQAEGFTSLTVSGLRYSGANLDRLVTITRSLNSP